MYNHNRRPGTIAQSFIHIAILEARSIEYARDFQAFLFTRQAAPIANRNIKMLKTFCTWAVKLGEMQCNPFDEIRVAKDSGLRSTKRDPFSLDKIQRILQAFRLHPLYFRYHGFVLMLLTFRLHLSKAIGLQWRDINFTQRTVTIAESLSHTGEGSRRDRCALKLSA